MLTIIICWFAIFLIFFLIGHIFHLCSRENLEWYEYFWHGLIIVFVILQIWSIFLPVNIYALFTITVLAAISLILFRKKIRIPKINIVFVAICVPVLLVISYYASQPVGWDDTLLYHLNAVKWANLYAVVPGLTNLHSRLGFNSSFFLFASMLDNWFMADKSSHLVLSLLAAVLSMEFVWIFVKSQDRLLKLFCLFSTPFIVYSIAKQEIIASLSPDFAVTILVLAVAIEFVKNQKSSILIAGFLSTLLITVKFSAVSFSAIVLIFILFRRRNLWKWILGGGILLILPYLIRNIYLSGWLLYPLPFFKCNVDWAMPGGQVKVIFTVIQTWARVPGTEWTRFIGVPFWKWFPVWYQGNQSNAEIKMFALGLILLFVSPFQKFFDRKFIRINKNMILLCFTSLISILYVFFTAPDIRFGGIFVWVFFSSMVSLYMMSLRWNHNLKTLTIFTAVAFMFIVSWPPRLDNEPILRSVRREQAQPTKNVNGVLVPTEGDLCGNSALPCTPENNNIKERVPGDLSKGFAPVN